MTRDEAKAKVAKLMALGADKRANENEAEAALRQAAWLMRTHDIEQAEITLATGHCAPFEWSTVLVPLDPKRYSAQCTTWIGQMALGVAKLTDTLADYAQGGSHGVCVRIRGEAVDVAYAVHLVKHLRDTIRRMSGNYAGTRKQKEDYRRAMVARLCQRMASLKAETLASTRQEAQTSVAASTALATIDRKAVERAAHFGTQKVRAARRSFNATAAADGRAAADRVGFGRPVDGPAAQHRLSA